MFDTKIPDAVCWQEGMRLTPQHFQQHALRQERLSAYLLREVLPDHWGLTTLRWHLDGSVFTVDEIEGLMPDGLYVRYDANEGTPLSLDLAAKTVQADNRGRYNVALAVRSVETALVQQGQGRYRQQLSDVADLNTGDNLARMGIQRPLLQLACSERAVEVGLDLLTLAQLEVDGNSYRSDYVPPSPRVTAGSALHRLANDAASRLRERYHAYTSRHQQLYRSGDAAGARELEWKLCALGARLPELDALLQDRAAHPRQLYQLLCGALGAIAAADPGTHFEAPRPFDYLNLFGCIDSVVANLKARLEGFPVPYERIAFAYDQQRSYTLPPEKLPRGGLCYIGLRAPLSATGADMARWLEGAKLASATSIYQVELNRLSGIPRRLLELQQAARIDADPSYAIFALDLSAPYFDPLAPLQLLAPPIGTNGQRAPLDVVAYRTTAAAPPRA